MRYFFTIIGVMIVWRSFSWLRKDRRQKHRRLKQLPDAGTIGILTVEQGSRHLKPGAMIPVPHEGVLGYLRTCDVVVPVEDVASTHLDFSFADGKGLFIYPRRGCEVTVDGIPLVSRRDSLQNPMQHGSVLEIGQAVLRLGVFAGLNVQDAQPAPCMPEDTCLPEDGWAPDAQQPWVPASQQPMPPYPQQGQTAYPPYGASAMPPVNQPPYYAPYPPVQAQDPWQGGDDDAQ